ncbi:MAG: trehalose-6-phosphate synthase [Nitrospinota bacterium]
MSGDRLVVVSNRLPEIEADFKTEARQHRPVGGLVSAIRPALKGRVGGIWLGWSGRSMPTSRAGGIVETNLEDTLLIALDLPETDFNAYYNGFCNRVLWPLCHSMPGRVRLSRSEERAYRRINGRFAHALAPRLSPNDLVWIQDFHLIPLGKGLRKLGWKGRTGFFLHIPFPPHEIWSILPDPASFLLDLLEYDLVGFHTRTYLENYVQACARTLGTTWDGSWLRLGGRRQRVGAFPIGIDVAHFRSAPEAAADRRQPIRGLGSVGDRKLILGVDRLDYTKGVLERMNAIEVLLRNRPEYRRSVSLVQICSPSRTRVPEYVEQKRLVETAVGRVNGEWGDTEWVPIRYLFRTFHPTDLARFYREADVGLVTPLRDGMNLVAKEFVAAQGVEDPGVLILSRFAGVAEEMPEAVMVNPYLAEDMADGSARALRMSPEERRERHAALLSRVLERPAHKWAEEFLQVLQDARRTAPPTPEAT